MNVMLNRVARRVLSAVAALGIAAVVGAAAPARASVNLLTNPGFEDGPSQSDLTGWTIFGGNGGGRPSPVHSGIQSFKAYGPFAPHGGDGVRQDVAITGGTTYQASVFAQVTSGDPLQGTNVGMLQLVFYDSSNTQLEADVLGQINSSAPTNQWIELSGEATAPGNATTVRINIMSVQGATPAGGSIYFDDASLSAAAVPEPASLALLVLGTGVLMTNRRRRSA